MKNYLLLVTSLCILLWASEKPNYGSRDLLFDQSATGLYSFHSCMWDSVYPMWSRVADNFIVPYQANIDSLVWWGGYWSNPINSIIDFWIEIYPDSAGNNQPKQDPIYTQRVPFSEINLGGYYRYETVIPPFVADPAEVYWIQFMATLIWPPQWGNNCSWPANNPGWGDGQECYFKSDFYGFPQWTSATIVWDDPYESSFQIYGTATGIVESLNDIINSSLSVIPTIGHQTATISFSLTSASRANIHLYNALGQKIRTLYGGKITAGNHKFKLSLKDLPIGVYFINLQADEVSITKELVVIR